MSDQRSAMICAEIMLGRGSWHLLLNEWGPLEPDQRSYSFENYEEGLAYFLPHVHAEDRPGIGRLIALENLRRLFDEGVECRAAECRVMLPEGGLYRWASLNLEFYHSKDDRRRRVVLSLKVSAEAHSRLREQNYQRISTVLQQLAEVYYAIDLIDMKAGTREAIRGPEDSDILSYPATAEGLEAYLRAHVDPDTVEELLKRCNYASIRQRLLDGESSLEFLYLDQASGWIRMIVYPLKKFTLESQNALFCLDDHTEEVLRLKNYEDQQQKLREATLRAEAERRAGELKTQFLASMSHEIRTPMNAIIGLSEIAMCEEMPENARDYIRQIRDSGKALLHMVNGILDFSRLESGGMELVEDAYDVCELLSGVASLINTQAVAKSLEFVAQVDSNVPSRLFGDVVRLREILINIGDNAVKFTQKGYVHLRMFVKPCDRPGYVNLAFELSDSGLGIEKSKQKTLFDAFAHLDSSAARMTEGSGLGLAVCRKLAMLMGGRVWLKSAPGLGSSFFVEIPQRVVDAAPCGNYEFDAQEAMAEADDFVAPEARVLVVDDHRVNLTVCEGLLKPYQMQVTCVESGAAALEAVQKQHYDLVLMDHFMPGMDGVETTKRIRALDGMSEDELPIVALTANTGKGAEMFFKRNGMNDFIPKPIDLRLFRSVLRKWIPSDKVTLSDKKPQTGEGVLPNLPGLNANRAMQYFSSIENYIDCLKTYWILLPENMEKLKADMKAEDWAEYTILVHAIKSNQRLVGAPESAAVAEKLEAAGRAGDRARIEALTPKLLSTMEQHQRTLGEYFSKPAAGALKPISEARFAEELEELRDYIDGFDALSADSWAEDMKQYAIPEKYAKLYQALADAIFRIDFKESRRLLSESETEESK